MTPQATHYDLIAIGSGPAGQGAAIQAAELGKRTALVERGAALGGTSINASTLPFQTLRAAVIELTGQSTGVYRNAYRVRQPVTVDDLFWRTRHVIDSEREAVHDGLRRRRIDVLSGSASFADPHRLVIDSAEGRQAVTAGRFVLAVGTRPTRPPSVAFDGRTVLDAHGILGLAHVPRRLTVVGGGAVGLEYASVFAALGVRVTLVDRRPLVLSHVDGDIVEALLYHLRGRGVVLRLGAEARAVQRSPEGEVVTELGNGEQLSSDAVIYAGGRRGATGDLDLAVVGLAADERGRIAVDEDYRTARPHIFAAGGVVGPADEAPQAMEQGRLAALGAFGRTQRTRSSLCPTAIYTLPELSFVGHDEQALRERGVPHVAGIAPYRDLARGEIAGDRAGLLKLVVQAETRRLLGVHILGTAATELVHVGQAVIAGGLSVDYLADAVFNTPAFAAAYRLAARVAAERLDTTAARAA